MNLTLGVDRTNVESKPETMRSAFDFLGKQPKHLAKKSVTLSSKASHNTRTRHLATATNMPSKSLSDAAKRARRRARLALEAIPGLPTHLVVAHILRSEYFDDPADLARLPAVSRGMRDAVAGTGLEFEELNEDEAVNHGCFSAVQRLQRGGLLLRQESLLSGSGEERTARRVEGVARKRLPVEPLDVHAGGDWRAPRGAEVGTREWLPVGQ